MIVIGVIPARYASTRFPGKPLVDINGKTMIQRVYEQAQKVLSYVCVATDDSRIMSAVKAFGGVAIMTSSNQESGTDRCAEAIAKFEEQKNIIADVVINIQGDEPFIDPIQIQQLVDIFNDENSEIATLIKKVNSIEVIDDVNKVKVVVDKNLNALYFSRSAIPFVRNTNKEEWLKITTFYHHVGMYGYKKDALIDICKLPKGILEQSESLEQLRWLENGYTIKTAITDIESFGIDTPDDLKKVFEKF